MQAEESQKPESRTGVHLWLLLWKATKAVEAQAHRSVKAKDLCLTDFGVLEALLHKGPLPVNALREKVLLSSGSMTAAVDRLERSGLVERANTPEDRRARIVHLTNKGSKLISRLLREHARDMEETFSCLTNGERDTLANLLRKLGHGAEKLSAGKPSSIANTKSRS